MNRITEMLLTQIGEFVSSEVDDVNKIDYKKENGELTAFTITMESGKKFMLTIGEVD